VSRARAWRFPLWLAALCALAPAASAADTPAGYRWKVGDVYRFEYEKKIEVTQPDENDKEEKRLTTVNAVLIIEITGVEEAAGSTAARGTLRYDSPRLSLPEVVTFTPGVSQPEVQKDKNRTAARAMEGAMKAARWKVRLDERGLVHLDSRQPETMSEWLKEPENAVGWRKKSMQRLIGILMGDLGLTNDGEIRDRLAKIEEEKHDKPKQAKELEAEAALLKAQLPVVDRELLLTLAEPPGTKASPLPADAVRPQRSTPARVSVNGTKFNYTFARRAPAGQATLKISGLGDLLPRQPITARVTDVTPRKGAAVFDTELGMLDSLDEEYSTALTYELDRDKLDQTVRVEYHLRRLAPPIIGAEGKAEP
jgi:hypothetical protein